MSDPETGKLPKRIGWFVLLWVAGVATIAVVGLVIKYVLMPA